eukprot:Blabericola_migrator_1__10694@NODE_6105_length_599_cov_4_360902_g4086_i0_p2_GENE_NODE_6105_length_599_cov_4_360902_g4086_i0NODE_6105_length_599_cov_4_360902_g4086_i0_p2_ORF_typecomplete_len104_score17_14_NODE_6105_length_599_cov_4_360902_g4086_i0285596
MSSKLVTQLWSLSVLSKAYTGPGGDSSLDDAEGEVHEEITRSSLTHTEGEHGVAGFAVVEAAGGGNRRLIKLKFCNDRADLQIAKDVCKKRNVRRPNVKIAAA